MNVLLIVHAIAWCDKERTAARPIEELIRKGEYDQIIEVTPAQRDIQDTRYLSHDGLVLEHEGSSPVSFLAERLFGIKPLFPPADSTTLVGGIANATGGGCLNVAFDHLARYLYRLGQPSTITLPIRAIYQAQTDDWWRDSLDVEQLAKDLVWKLVIARVPFDIVWNGERLAVASGVMPIVRVEIDSSGIGIPMA